MDFDALVEAVEKCDIEKIDAGLKQHDVNHKPESYGDLDWSLLVFALEMREPDAGLALLERGAWNLPEDVQIERVCHALQYGPTPLAQKMLELGAPLHLRRRGGASALYCAAHNKNDKAIKAVLAAGASLEDGEGREALGAACRAANTKAVKMLLQAGVDPNAADKYGVPALSDCCASQYGAAAAARALVKAGADLHWVRAEDQATLLHIAAQHSNNKMAKYLVKAGLSPEAVDATDKRPIEWIRPNIKERFEGIL